jgi:DNA-binding transcriptional LysR family regulator
MELRHLAYFVAVADHQHFTRAAEALHIAQPSLSQQIRKLEEEIGNTLFERTRGQVTLTEAGQHLLPHARALLARSAEAERELAELANLERGRLRLGALPALSASMLPPLLVAYHERHPGIGLELHEAPTITLLRQLEHREVDLALTALPTTHGYLGSLPLGRELLSFAVSPGHALANRESVNPAELRDEPFILWSEGSAVRDLTLRICRQAGFEPKVVLECAYWDTICSMVAAGLGITLVPEQSLSPISRSQIAVVRLADGGHGRQIGLLWRRDGYQPATARAFIDLVREVRGSEFAVRGDTASDLHTATAELP